MIWKRVKTHLPCHNNHLLIRKLPATVTVPAVTRVTVVQVERQEEKHSKCLVIYTWVSAVLCCLVGNILCGIFALIRARRKNYKNSLILSHVGIAIYAVMIIIIVVAVLNMPPLPTRQYSVALGPTLGNRYIVDDDPPAEPAIDEPVIDF